MKTLRWSANRALLFGALLLSVPSALAQEDGVLRLTADSLSDEPGSVIHFEYGRGHFGPSVALVGTWRYRVGDDHAWADPHYDDSAWTSARTWIDYHAQEQGTLPPGMPGIGWFRLHLRVDSALAQMPLGLAVYRGNAAEVYLDGELVHKTGRVGRTQAEEEPRRDYTPTSISLHEDTTHVLAVRYSNFSAEKILKAGEDAGFYLVLGVLPVMLESHARLTRQVSVHQILLTGILLALAFLHFVLFLFFPKARAHLYFAIFAASFAGVIFGYLQLHFVTSADANLLRFRLVLLVALLNMVSLVFFAHMIARERVPQYVYVLATVGVVLGIGLWFRYIRPLVLVFAITTYADAVRVLVGSVLHKREGAWIVTLGLLPGVVFTILYALHLLQVVAPFWNIYEVPVYGYAMLPLALSMSIYLARDFARTKRGLALANVRLEDYSRTLEQKVEARTRELQTEKEKTEAQARRLRELDQLKSRFFANVSHEFRTPLTLIAGPLEAGLPDDPAERRQQEHLMLRSTRRLLRLVNQLLDLAKLERGKLALDVRTHDLVPFLRGVVEAFTPLAERHRVTLTYRPAPPALSVAFDAEKLEQVVGNLLSNALKFTPEGGKVCLAVRRATHEGAPVAEIVVKDTGPGIAKEDLKRIFDRFEQVDGSVTRAHEGAGIGLALAWELVELHGGTISVESEPGFGSTFTVRLPAPALTADVWPEEVKGDGAAPTEAVLLEAAAIGESPPVLAPSGEAPTDADAPLVLLVEDSAEVRAFLRRHLAPTYRLLEAADGAQALALAHRHHPDLILSDVMMPGMDGLTLCRALKADERLRAIPIVLLTAKAADADAVEGYGCGADAYVTKPFAMDVLQARLAALIAARHRLRDQYARTLRLAPADIEVPAAEEAFLTGVLAAAEAHLGASTFGVDALAEAVGLSRRQLERRLKETLEETPAALLRRLRMERAAQLLEAGAMTVQEVAAAVGYRSASHFARAFREHFGHLPTEHPPPQTERADV